MLTAFGTGTGINGTFYLQQWIWKKIWNIHCRTVFEHNVKVKSLPYLLEKVVQKTSSNSSRAFFVCSPNLIVLSSRVEENERITLIFLCDLSSVSFLLVLGYAFFSFRWTAIKMLVVWRFIDTFPHCRSRIQFRSFRNQLSTESRCCTYNENKPWNNLNYLKRMLKLNCI